jgi:UTP--glucose-1-phosphate uridylyltransferase
MLPLVDRDGLTKPVLQVIVEEALESGIESIVVVVAPGDEEVYRRLFRTQAASLRSGYKGEPWAEEQAKRLLEMDARLRFAVQADPCGYGHAVWCAREHVGNEPFLLLLSDHLYISNEPRRCARQLLDLVAAEGCAASAVQATREHLIHHYGTVSGRRLHDRPDVYAIEQIIEKPNPTVAELKLQVPGLRVGHYLCFFGMHALVPAVFSILEDLVKRDAREAGSIQLTTALNSLAARERYLALETKGTRHNVGVKYGVIEAQVALALAGVDRQRMLASLLETVARVESQARAD